MNTDQYLKQEEMLVDKLKAALINETVKSNKPFVTHTSDTGIVISVSGTTIENLLLEVQFTECVKKLSFKIGFMTSSCYSFTDFDTILLAEDCYSQHKLLYKEFHEYELEQQELEREATKLAAEDAEAARKQKAYEQNALRKFETYAKNPIDLSPSDQFYYDLGWLASHATAITAKLPEFLNSAFDKYFGSDAERTVIDSTRKTSGGYSMQWSWGFSIRVKSAKTMPETLAEVFKHRSILNNTSYVWSLVQNYGFKFGKEQSVTRILSYIPTEYKTAFTDGVAAE